MLRRPENKLLFLALIALSFYSLVLQMGETLNDPEYITKDARSYMSSAKMLYEQFKPHPKRALGFATFLSAPLILGAKEQGLVWYSFVVNCMLWCGTVVIVYKTSLFLMSRNLAFASALVYLGAVGSAAGLNLVLSETLFTMLLSIGYYLLVSKWQCGKRLEGLLYLTTLVLLSATVRPGALYLGLIMLLISLIIAIKEVARPPKKAWAPLGLVVIFLLGSMSLMHKHYQVFTISNISKITWYPYLGSQVEAQIKGRSFEAVKKERHEEIKAIGDWPSIGHLANEDLKSKVITYPGIILCNLSKNIFDNTRGGSSAIQASADVAGSSWMKSILYGLSKFQNLLFTILGLTSALIMSIYRRNLVYFFGLGIMAYIVLTSGISFWQGDRFHISFYPIAIMMIFSSVHAIRQDFFPPQLSAS